jgi:hypothetical protein
MMKRVDRSGSLLHYPMQSKAATTSAIGGNQLANEFQTNMSWLHNDKSMAIKWAFLGTYCSIPHLNHQHMSSIYGFSSNDGDWSAQNRKIIKAKHRDVIVNRLFDAVKKIINKANEAFIKTWLGAWKANIKDAIQAQKRKHPRNQKHESNC